MPASGWKAASAEKKYGVGKFKQPFSLGPL